MSGERWVDITVTVDLDLLLRGERPVVGVAPTDSDGLAENTRIASEDVATEYVLDLLDRELADVTGELDKAREGREDGPA